MSKPSLSEVLLAALKEIAGQGLTDDEKLNKKLDNFVDDVKANSIEPLVLIGEHGLSEMNVKPVKAVSLLVESVGMEIDDTGDDHNEAAFEAIMFLSSHLSKPIAKEVQGVLFKYVKDRHYVEPEMGGQDD